MRLENSIALLTKGYAWLPDLRRARGVQAVESASDSAPPSAA